MAPWFLVDSHIKSITRGAGSSVFCGRKGEIICMSRSAGCPLLQVGSRISAVRELEPGMRLGAFLGGGGKGTEKITLCTALWCETRSPFPLQPT